MKLTDPGLRHQPGREAGSVPLAEEISACKRRGEQDPRCMLARKCPFRLHAVKRSFEYSLRPLDLISPNRIALASSPPALFVSLAVRHAKSAWRVVQLANTSKAVASAYDVSGITLAQAHRLIEILTNLAAQSFQQAHT